MRSLTHNRRLRLIGATIALLITLLIVQLEGALSSGSESTNSPQMRSQSIMAVLIVPGNQPISVNSAKTISGATLLSGATIATPDRIGATLRIGSLGSLDLAPNTILTTDFDEVVNVKLTRGCLILRARKGVTGEVVTSNGITRKTDPSQDGRLEVCFPQDTWPVSEVEGNEGRGPLHFARVAALAVIGGRVRSNLAVGLDDRGSNPGPSAP